MLSGWRIRRRTRTRAGRLRGERGATVIEYGLLAGLLGIAAVGGAAFLVNASKANYNDSEGKVADLNTSCVGDEILDPGPPQRCIPNPIEMTSINPSFGPVTGGTSVTIRGKGFGTSPTVTFDGVAGTVATGATDTQVVVTTPAGTLGPADVIIRNPSTTYSDKIASFFTYATVPAAPAAPTAVAGNNSVSLSWSAPTDSGGIPVSGYRVERRVAPSGSWTVVAADTGTAVTSYIDATAANGTPYQYRISAINAIGTGPASPASLSATPAASAPGAPTITAVTGAVRQLSVAFTPGFDGGATITNYEYSIDGGSWVALSPLDAVSPLTVPNAATLANGTSYGVRIRAVNAVATGAASNTVSGTTVGVPSAPAITSVTSASQRLILGFSAPSSTGGSPISNYEFSTNGGTTWTALSPASTSSPVTIPNSTSLTNGTSYSVALRAVNGAGSGAASAVVTGIPGQASAPTITSVTGGVRTLSVAFTAPVSNGGVTITNYQYSTDGGATWKNRASGTTASPISITTVSSGAAALADGVSYQVEIRALNGVNGVESNTVAGTTFDVASAPTITSVAGANQKLSVTFTPPSDDGGSSITNYQYSTDGGTTFTALSSASTTSPITIPNGNLTNGTSYNVVIRAVNGVGNGASSNTVAGVPGQASAPTITSITRGVRSLTVNFTAGSNGGVAITNYQYSLDGGTWTALSPADNSTPVTISGLANGTTYSVRIRALNGVTGLASNASSATTFGLPTAPSISSISRGVRTLTVAFGLATDDGSGITNYEYSTDGGSTWKARATGTNTSPLVITTVSSGSTNLANNTSYNVEIRAVSAVGTGPESNTVSARTAGVPVAITDLSLAASGQTNRANLTWTVDDNGSAITVYAIDSAPFSSGSCGSTWTNRLNGAATSPWTSPDMGNGTFCFRIRATNGVGQQTTWSNTPSINP